jgi:outer membrane protein OmpA-like peptidoglycan-associated protein
VLYLRHIRSGAAILVIAATAASAQAPRPRAEDVAFRLGAISGITRNTHDTRATVFTGGGECGAFSSGTGNGYVAGLVGEFPLLAPWLDLAALATIAERGGDFGDVTTGGLPILDPTTDTYTELVRRHTYTAQVRAFVAELGVRVTPFPEIPAYLRATTAIAIPLAPTYAQREEIVSPSGVLYPENNRTERDVASGDIADAAQFASVAGTIGYDLPLGPRLTVAPEVSYYFPLGDVTSSYRWRIATLQGAIAAKWSFGGHVPEPIVEATPVLDLVERPMPVASTLAPMSALSLTQTVVTETFPILPYVFFEEGSASLPGRYARIGESERAGFREDALPRRSLDAYYQLLNIIGRRLDETAGARITLKGTADAREEKVPGAANNLARARAQAVKDYLVESWGIDPGRIEVVTSDRPTHPSSTVYAEGWHENRRVEIAATRDDILRPVLHRRFNEYTATPTTGVFAGASSGPIDAWEMRVMAGDEIVWQSEATGAPPERFTWSLDDATIEKIGQRVGTTDSLRCELTLVPTSGESVTRVTSMPVTKTLQPYEVSRLSLIVFDFDRAEITEQNRRMVSSFVAGSIAPNSTATITGSTDRLGELDHNRQLSLARAESVRSLIMTERPTASITRVEGLGPSKLPYSNDVPEGRYYCRTVAVEVLTPIVNAASAE